LDGGKLLHALPRHGHRVAVAAHFQPMVAARQLALAQLAQRERRAPVRTKVLQRRHLPVLVAVEHDFLLADGAPEQALIDLVGVAGHVPGIFQEHAHSYIQYTE